MLISQLVTLTSSGVRGIRTPETLLTFTRFPGVPLQPLEHHSFSVYQNSVCKVRYFFPSVQILSSENFLLHGNSFKMSLYIKSAYFPYQNAIAKAIYACKLLELLKYFKIFDTTLLLFTDKAVTLHYVYEIIITSFLQGG